MLMQPQSPDHQFDFMLKQNQPATKGLGMSKLPKPLVVGIGIILLIILAITISSVLSGRKNGASQPIIDSVVRGEEVIRVTKVVQTLGLQDPSTNAASYTVLAALSSDHTQLSKYLVNLKAKLSLAQLAADTDKTIDAQMQSAQQNNNLDQAYISYLQLYLPKYQHDLQIAYQSAPGPKGKTILKMAYDSETALLTNPPLKS